MKVYITFKNLKSMNLKTVGNINSEKDLKFGDLAINNTGVGNAEVNAEKELKVKDSFLGKVKNKGNATAKRLKRVTI